MESEEFFGERLLVCYAFLLLSSKSSGQGLQRLIQEACCMSTELWEGH